MKTNLSVSGACATAFLLCWTGCKPRADIDSQTPVSSVIKSVTYEQFYMKSQAELLAVQADFSRLATSLSDGKSTTVFTYDSSGRVSNASYTHALNPGYEFSTRYVYKAGLVIRTSTPARTLVTSDTIYTDQAGRVVSVPFPAESWYPSRRNLYGYGGAGQVSFEQRYLQNACGGMLVQFSGTHKLLNGDRIQTKDYYSRSWVDDTLTAASASHLYTLNYEYDLSGTNPNIPYDELRLSDGCSSILRNSWSHPGLGFGFSNHLLKKVTVSVRYLPSGQVSPAGVYKYSYEFDAHNRVKTVYLYTDSQYNTVVKRTIGYVEN